MTLGLTTLRQLINETSPRFPLYCYSTTTSDLKIKEIVKSQPQRALMVLRFAIHIVVLSGESTSLFDEQRELDLEYEIWIWLAGTFEFVYVWSDDFACRGVPGWILEYRMVRIS